MGNLDGRVAIVTGAGRGIGRGVAKLLAGKGAAVVVNDVGAALDGSGQDAGPADEVVAEIEKDGGAAIASGTDVSDYSAVEELVRSTVEMFGGLHIVVNVAAILRDRMVFNMSEQEWDDVIRVHLKGAFNTTRHAAAYWRELRDDKASNRIINFTSASGLFGNPGQANYAAAKMGVVGLTFSCARGLSRLGATVNAISPGAATRMVDAVPEGKRVKRTEKMLEQMQPENVAPIVGYLASERSGWINGRIIHAIGYQLTLFRNPEPWIRIIGSGPFETDDNPDGLDEAVESAFGPVLGYEA